MDIKDIYVFAKLKESEGKALAPYWGQITLRKGQFLFSEGEEGDALYYVLSGEIVLYKDCNDALPLEMGRVAAGQFLGELAVLEDSWRSASAQAATETHLAVLKKESFYTLLDRHPKIGIVLLMELARMVSLQLRHTTGQYITQHTG